MPLTSADINKVVSFNVYPAAIIGSTFEKVKVLAILDAESAFAYIDPAAMHVNVYPTLPVGTPNNYESYQYVKVRLQNNQVTCVGIPWIDDATIVVHQNVQITAVINNVTPDDLPRIRNALIAAGYNQIALDLT